MPKGRRVARYSSQDFPWDLYKTSAARSYASKRRLYSTRNCFTPPLAVEIRFLTERAKLIRTARSTSTGDELSWSFESSGPYGPSARNPKISVWGPELCEGIQLLTL